MKLKTKIITLALICVAFVARAQDPWIVSAKNFDHSDYYGITVANGVLGVISSPQPLKIKEVVLAGAYDMFGRGRVGNFLPSFNLLNAEIKINGEVISDKNISNFEQRLNMKKAQFEASFDFKDLVTVEYSYVALRHLPFTVMMDVTIKSKKNVSIICSNLLETPSSLIEPQQMENTTDAPIVVKVISSVAKSPTRRLTMAASNSFLFNEERNAQPSVVHQTRDNNMHIARFDKDIVAGKSYNFAIIGSCISSVHNPDPLNQAERLTIYASLEGKERLLQRHQEAWCKLWESDIEIQGDPQAQQDVRSMLYHMYSFNREGTDFSPSPMGLSGLGYNGHVFWDTELWMFPPMLILQPELAKSMIEYRYKRLEAAKQNAFSYGYKGAMYPWESADTGAEETPVWALTGTFEHHITADVGIAAWNYYLVTQDKAWLEDKGWDILRNTAQFWESRVEKNNNGIYEIKNVVAADEWAENVDNNAFTNAAAMVNIRYAIKCAQLLGKTYPAIWEDIAQNIPISKMSNGVTREHDTYNGEKIKQADVNLLAYPLNVIKDREQIKADLEYYQTKVPNSGTPAMTQAVFSLLYSRLGDSQKAGHFFNDAYVSNLNPPFRVIAEFKGGTNPYFVTGAGGVLQAVIMGFAGVNINPDNGIERVESVLPPSWTRLTIKGVGKDKDVVVKTK
ncbi:MAG: hypothetical protein RL662_1142 [Bacteroidota bacterium]|jgi:trehalose/maltose hydrolase-like predicted phosphorylase